MGELVADRSWKDVPQAVKTMAFLKARLAVEPLNTLTEFSSEIPPPKKSYGLRSHLEFIREGIVIAGFLFYFRAKGWQEELPED